ncbi:hypothetical protein DENIS_0665 [Desulfonema ishimotonii]|uniref:Solute-binding protein family 3/N-terminal domain-containing protein n=1 Tax=Desulfonema ishimotonii TaxID=45657 RepID=A0A401FRY3_9BACT|nr:hypothetical protein [Desulfonema ishimotonii]GBC59724.1 hypothetical protein DENIS_0665 [Desulfonema ishimotonii]
MRLNSNIIVWFRLTVITALMLIFPPASDADEAMTVRYQDLPRYEYHTEIMKAAFERGREKFGPIRLEPILKEIPGQRVKDAMIAGKTGAEIVDIMVRPTDRDIEKKLTPIRIPLDRGLLGWRVFMIRQEDRKAFRAIRMEADLKKRILGQGSDWIDVKIYEHSGYTVKTAWELETLFRMLSAGRFDYLAFGVDEYLPLLEHYSKLYPNLAMADSLAIHYPFVRYFWTADTQKGKQLRERLTLGLEAMIADGSFDRIFIKYFGKALKEAKLGQRTVFHIENPILPDTLPLERRELWFSPGRFEKTN